MRYDFPFNILEVADILGIAIRGNGKGSSVDADCPFCNRKSKFNLNTEKDAFRCNYCDEKGGMLTLYGMVKNINNSAAFEEICDILGYDNPYRSKSIANRSRPPSPISNHKPAPKPESKQPKRADAEIVHRTYLALLDMLTLKTTHKEHLLARGLSMNDIIANNFKSVPSSGHQSLCKQLMAAGHTIEGVPGFYKIVDSEGNCTGVWNVKLGAPGILIPVRGIDGRVSNLQIRLDKPFEDKKYIWLSSGNEDTGVSSGSSIHFVGNPAAEKVFITEGPLKGIVANAITNYTFICLPSSNNMGKLNEMLTILKANGVKIAVEALDKDKETNEHVGKSAKKLRRLLADFGFVVESAVWTDEKIKGVDDFYFNLRKTRQEAARHSNTAAKTASDPGQQARARAA